MALELSLMTARLVVGSAITSEPLVLYVIFSSLMELLPCQQVGLGKCAYQIS